MGRISIAPLLARAGAVIVCVLAAVASAPAPASAASPRPRGLPVALPDTGSFTISFQGRPSGEERFAIRADGGRIVAEGRTSLRLGGLALESDSRLTLDAALHPLRFRADLTTDGRPTRSEVDLRAGQSIVRTERGGASRTDTVPYATDAVFVPDNTLYALVLVYHTAARRGLARGRVTLPLYPNGTVDVRRAGTRTVSGVRLAAYDVNLSHLLALTFFVDRAGRVVRIVVPLQGAVMERRGVFARAPDDTLHRPPAAGRRPAPPGLAAEEVVFPSASVALAGTFLKPAIARGPLPAVVLLSGSGAQDRDEDSPSDAGGIHLGILRLVAERLARAGLAVLRFDDRGVGGSAGTFAGTSFTDHVMDARAALAFLRTREDVDQSRLAVVGHSEGGIIALVLAADDPSIRAIGLMAGTAQPFSEILMAQAIDQARKAGLPDAAVRQVAAEESVFIETLRARAEWMPERVPDRFLSMRSLRPWLEEVIALDMPPVVKRVRAAVGIFQGGRDDQVAPHAAAALDSLLEAGGNRDHVVYRFPLLNHLFVRSDGGGYAEYTDPRRRVDDRFLSTLARWARTRLVR